jgi:hypothetical protein
LKRLFQKNDPSVGRADQAACIRDVLAHLDLAEVPTVDLPGYRLHG